VVWQHLAKPSEEGRILWRVGCYADPLGFTPLSLYQFSHRFDDLYRRPTIRGQRGQQPVSELGTSGRYRAI
jgi:hypothetical protein